jgi:hypothetical protein
VSENVAVQYDEASDCFIGTVALRAERDSSQRGRVYAITCRVTDEADNSTSATCEVVVPKDRGKR